MKKGWSKSTDYISSMRRSLDSPQAVHESNTAISFTDVASFISHFWPDDHDIRCDVQNEFFSSIFNWF